MATATKSPPITVEQYQSFAGYPGLRDELIAGMIVLSPQPKPLHQQICENVLTLLRGVLRGQQRYVAKQDSNIRFREANSMPAPDVFVVTSAAWQEACQRDEYLSETPLLVVEVISPANRKTHVADKVRLYLSQGVPMVWVVRPKKKTIQVHRQQDTRDYTGPVPLVLPAPLVGTIPADAVFTLPSSD